MLMPFAAAVLMAGPIADAATFGRLVENLSRTRQEFHTAKIEFKLERYGPVSRTTRGASCTLTMFRTEGTVFGKLELRPDDPFELSETFVLRGDDVSWWDERSKTVTNFASAKKGGFRFVADNFSGLLWLLDGDEAAKRVNVRVRNRYTHATTLALKVDEYPIFSLREHPRPYAVEYHVTVMTTASARLPRNVPMNVVRFQPSGDIERYKITKWAVDAPAHVDWTAADFPDPAKPPEGWTVRP